MTTMANPTILIVVVILISSTWAAFHPPDPVELLAETSPICSQRPYTFKVKQEDPSGRSCWDMVTVLGCWGRCNSHEIADWRFPFKRSHHPVCQHEEILSRPVLLQNCDPDVEPGTELYLAVDAQGCRCQLCRPDVDRLVHCEGNIHPAVDRRLSPSRRSHA